MAGLQELENAPADIAVALCEEGPVADSIRRELELAFPAMYGVSPSFAETAQDAALCVTFARNAACGLGEEGYRIDAAHGTIRVTSGGKRGLFVRHVCDAGAPAHG